MTTQAVHPAEEFDWTPQPAAAEFLAELLDRFRRQCPAIVALERRLLAETGTRLVDWIDHLALPSAEAPAERLTDLGFEAFGSGPWTVWRQPRGLFPPVHAHHGIRPHLALRVESVADFMVADFIVANRLDDARIEGEPLAQVRKTRFFAGQQADLWAFERHGSQQFDPAPIADTQIAAAQTRAVLQHREAFRRRKRNFAVEREGFDHASDLVRAAAAHLGTDWACDLFFAAEREYWQSRNTAGRVQKARQDRLGLGWANHDHHTYRSSRDHFTRLIRVLEQLGFVCRERFYGGHGAGWGAQVLEQPACGIVIFADVDLTPEEVTGDFAHEPLPDEKRLGTVGLWCKLHGEAFLQAGMHHLECQFDFDAARDQLRELGIQTMKPFTDFPYLKQAFTAGDTWQVDPQRLDRALADGSISPEQAKQFRRSGVIGSHLEILQRDDGYKGFRTYPRTS